MEKRVRIRTATMRLSDEGRELLATLAQVKGISRTAVVESLVRQEARREGVQTRTNGNGAHRPTDGKAPQRYIVDGQEATEDEFFAGMSGAEREVIKGRFRNKSGVDIPGEVVFRQLREMATARRESVSNTTESGSAPMPA